METAEQIHAIAQLPPDLALLRMENENIQALAAAKPRDHEAIRKDLEKQINAYPSFVKTAIYCKPVGKDESGQMKYARGLSIRAAEAIAEAYGFCRIRADVTPLDDNTVKVEATFSDYQKGRIWQDGGVLSKFYRAKSGQMQRIPDDRFFNVTVKAEVSKRVREVILRSVPPGLRSELAEMVETRIDNLLDDSTMRKIIANFASKGVTEEMLEKHIGRTMKAGWTKEDRKNLVGIWNALEQEETTVAEIFGDNQTPANSNGNGNKAKPPVNGSVSAADLTGNGKAKPPAAPAGEEKAPEGTTTPPAPESPAVEAQDKSEPGLYTCTVCGWTGDKLMRGGACPQCHKKDGVQATADLEELRQQAEPDLSDVTAQEVEMATAKPTVRCLSCKKEYVTRPKVCECGSLLGWKEL
jgi:hypothetical protein